jgi:hypothetical protein
MYEPSRVSELEPSFPKLSDCPSLSDRFWGVYPTESRAETILSEPSTAVRIVQCPNADPCFLFSPNFLDTNKAQFFGSPFSLRNFIKNRSNLDLEQRNLNYCSTVFIRELYLLITTASPFFLIMLQKPHSFQTLIYKTHLWFSKTHKNIFQTVPEGYAIVVDSVKD